MLMSSFRGSEGGERASACFSRGRAKGFLPMTFRKNGSSSLSCVIRDRRRRKANVLSSERREESF